MLRTLLTGLTSLLYPDLCPHCRRRIGEPAGALCTECTAELSTAPTLLMERRLRNLSPDDRAASPISWARAGWVYDSASPLRSVVQALKYAGRADLGVRIGRELGRSLAGEIERFARDRPLLGVPVPLGRLRALERGYNQSERILLGLSEACEIVRAPSVLHRRRSTLAQARLSVEDRWENVADAFAVIDTDPRPSGPIVLVDDVCTTGSTITAAADALHRAGWDRVGALACGLAIVHTQRS